MRFALLGSLEVTGPDGPIEISGPKRRGLLAYLLVRRDEPVSVERIAHDLWDGHPTAGAPGTVRTYVSQLRKTLAPVGCCAIETLDGGYRLRVDADRLDSAAFEAGCADAARRPDATTRLIGIDDALRLWRGAPLLEFAGAEWADIEATRLHALHLQALHLRIDTLLDLGRHADAIPELERLRRDHHLDERIWGQLMLAYYRAGRQADALRSYQEVRSVLVDELGVEPGPALRELEAGILAHDAALAAPAPPSPPVEPPTDRRTAARPPRPHPRRRGRTRIAAWTVAAVAACALGLAAVDAQRAGDAQPNATDAPSAEQQLRDARSAVAASSTVELVVEYDVTFGDPTGDDTEHGVRRQAVAFPDRGRSTETGRGRTTETLYIGDSYYVHEGTSPATLTADPFRHARLDDPTLGLAHADGFPLRERPQDLARILDAARNPVLTSDRGAGSTIRVDFSEPPRAGEPDPRFLGSHGTVVLDDRRRPTLVTIAAQGPQGTLTAEIHFARWNRAVVIDTPGPASLDPTPPTVELRHLRVVDDNGRPFAATDTPGVMACPLDHPDPANCGASLHRGADPGTGLVRPLEVDPLQGYQFTALARRDDWPCSRFESWHFSDTVDAYGWELLGPRTFVIHRPRPEECGT